MRAPPNLTALVEDGLIEAVLRPLQSGKEAQVYLVRAGGETCVAKVYKGADDRNFKNRSVYQEGRGTRNTRDRRAMKRRSSYGRSRDEEAWQSTEVDMIRRLHEAGVRVPQPYLFSDGVLVMELVEGSDGDPAPRLGDLRVGPDEAIAIHDALLRDVVRMLCAGVVHGDLSEFNVLVDENGPVIIDLPQAVDASSNPSARELLVRDVENLQRFVTRWVPGRKRARYAAEMWALYEVNELEPDTELTGVHEGSTVQADTDALLGHIADAEADETMRRIARGEAPVGTDPQGRRVLENPAAKPPPRERPKRSARPKRGDAAAASAAASPSRAETSPADEPARDDADARGPRRKRRRRKRPAESNVQGETARRAEPAARPSRGERDPAKKEDVPRAADSRDEPKRKRRRRRKPTRGADGAEPKPKSDRSAARSGDDEQRRERDSSRRRRRPRTDEPAKETGARRERRSAPADDARDRPKDANADGARPRKRRRRRRRPDQPRENRSPKD